MTFRVEWETAALDDLDQIWREADDKEGIENTAVRINTELTYQPLSAGESRDNGRRVLFKFPLIVWFRVLAERQEVRVLHVYAIKRQ